MVYKSQGFHSLAYKRRGRILKISQLKKYFPVTSGVFLRRTGWVHAVDDVSFSVAKGETLGIVGESGCGKTTLGRCIMGLYPFNSGDVSLDGESVTQMSSAKKRSFFQRVQMIFQDPFESLNPRQTVREILEEKFKIHGQGNPSMDAEVNRLMEKVGLRKQDLLKYPHEFSGGQRQRIGVARAVSMSPEIIICDEPVSALDVSVQSKILNLLLDLQRDMNLTYLFISHDLSVVKHLSDRIIVMYLGKIVEIADAKGLYERPFHPYTQALLSAIPQIDPELKKEPIVLTGEVPSAENPPRGCRFNTRCSHAFPICFEIQPLLEPDPDDPGHLAACHLKRQNP